MANTPHFPIKNVLGWKPSDDRSLALIGFSTSGGQELSLGLTEFNLFDTIRQMVDATSAFPFPTTARHVQNEKVSRALQITDTQFGHTPSTMKFFLRLTIAGRGHLEFDLDRNVLSDLVRQIIGELQTAPNETQVLAEANGS